jgi:16S rRNA (uracil1498-N3)-methyltransferase
LHQDFLSDIELYFSEMISADRAGIIIRDDEAHHALNVMRHSEGDILYVTDGKGSIYKSEITHTKKNNISLKILEVHSCENNFEKIIFCIPRLKSQDRFEFAVEKCIELGITNFIVFESERTIARGDKKEKWVKLGISAMKQSLRSFLPEFTFQKSIEGIIKNCSDGETDIYLFEQNAEKLFSKEAGEILKKGRKSVFVFGPEGGISEKELSLFSESQLLRLTKNRLRSETAIISAGILLSQSN